MNFIIISFISVFLTILIYVLHNKFLKKDIKKLDIAKLGVLGFLIASLNYLILNNTNTQLTNILGDFDSGAPPF